MARRVPGSITELAKKLGLFDILQRLVKQGQKLDDIDVGRLRSQLPRNSQGDINWNPSSRPTFGHTFSEHGAGARNTQRLTDRARSTGQPQGQWLDNDRAAAHLRDNYDPNAGTRNIPIPEGLGQVIRPDGSIVPVRDATVVPRPGGIYRTAYPVE